MSEKAPKDQEQHIAEAEVEEFREDLGPFVVAAETTRMAMVFTDAKEADNPIIFANDSFLKLTGYARDELLAKPFNFLLASPSSDETLGEIKSCFEPGADDVPGTLLVGDPAGDDGGLGGHLSLSKTVGFSRENRLAPPVPGSAKSVSILR